MKCIAILAVLFGVAIAAPAKLDHLLSHSGYNYEPPAQPSGLYEVPETTTTTTQPPPPEPGYLPPAPSDRIDIVKKPMPKMLMPYQFNYGVSDPDSGNQFAHSVDSDGEDVKGEYSVLLPDGRLQIVRFTSNSRTGYVAEVTYQEP